MLVIPMRSPTPSPTRQANTLLPSRSNRSESPATSELRKQVAGTMLSVMPPPQPSTSKRPKLSLQTALPPVVTSFCRRTTPNAVGDADSPTARNTVANTIEAPPPTPQSTLKPYIKFPQPSLSITPSDTLKPEHVSKFPRDAPYTMPIGTHGILRNTPLPKLHSSATSIRISKRILFPPTKHVTFSEKPPDIMPTPVIEGSLEEVEDKAMTDEERVERKANIDAEDGHSSMRGSQSKRNREWIWRPMPEDLPGAGEDVMQYPATENHARIIGEKSAGSVAEGIWDREVTGIDVFGDQNRLVRKPQIERS